MRSLAVSLVMIALAASPAAAQFGDEMGRSVWSASAGAHALPSYGLSVTGAYGREVGFARLVLAADAILLDNPDTPYSFATVDGQLVCQDDRTGEALAESECTEGLAAAVRSEMLFGLPGPFSLGPGLRYDGTFTPYAAVQFERRLQSAAPTTGFVHAGAGLNFLQIDVGVSISY